MKKQEGFFGNISRKERGEPMEFQEFIEYVKEHILEYMPEEYQDRYPEVNSYYKEEKEVNGLVMRKGQEKEISIEPTFPLENFYQEIQEGRKVDEVLQEIAGFYKDALKSKEMYGIEKLETFVELKNHFLSNLITAVYPAEKIINKGNMPYLQINDLALTAKIKLGAQGTVAVTDKLAEQIQMDGDTILTMAMEQNRKNARPKVRSMVGTMEEYLEEEGISVDLQLPEVPFYVLTSDDYTYGASFIADKELLGVIAEKFQSKELVILPSSIHELILAPVEQIQPMDMEELCQGVRDVNQAVVSPEEFLSDNVYLFNAERKELQMYAGQLCQEKVESRKYLKGPHM